MIEEEYYRQERLEKNNWWFATKTNRLADVLRTFLGNTENNILEIGCGTGTCIPLLQKYGRVVSIDKSPHAINVCRQKKFHPLLMNVEDDLPFERASFDVVVLLDVIEHIKKDVSVLEKINELLKQGGILLLTTSAFKHLWSEHDGDVQHFRRYTKKNLAAKLKNTGYRVVRQNYTCALLYFPLLFLLILSRLRVFKKKISTEMLETGALMNSLLTILFKLEIKLSRFVSFPFGTGIISIATK
ncbi:MAG: class I SAM-dependent methyltransferase [Deltaproteobacteria bacterium]|nr:class I SAM-dependent methyltransferase [Deltaproteobacteria bacterium]